MTLKIFQKINLIKKKKFKDLRGQLIKPFSRIFVKNFDVGECYYTLSKKNVIRGINYQTSKGCKKIVFVAKGKILDVLVDLRKNSKTYKKVYSSVIDDNNDHSILIPPGFGHGYKVLSKEAIVFYIWNKTLNQTSDHTILWSSINFKWGIEKPILSKNDKFADILK